MATSGGWRCEFELPVTKRLSDEECGLDLSSVEEEGSD